MFDSLQADFVPFRMSFFGHQSDDLKLYSRPRQLQMVYEDVPVLKTSTLSASEVPQQ